MKKVLQRKAAGQLSIRERIDLISDPGSFHEIGPVAGGSTRRADGTLEDFTPANFVLGTAQLEGRTVILSGYVQTVVKFIAIETIFMQRGLYYKRRLSQFSRY